MNKILLVGAFAAPTSNQYTYATSFYRTLIKLGFVVEYFNYRANYIPLIPATVTSLPPLVYVNQKRCNKALMRHVNRFKPDLIFCIKAENINATTIQQIKKLHPCPIINFYPDNPFTLWNGNSNSEVLRSLPLYDCFLSWSPILTPALYAAGCKQVCFFPFAYEEEMFNNIPRYTHNELEPYVSDVCFIGTWEPEREQWLGWVVEQLPNVNLAIWGNQWQDNCHHPLLKKIIRGPAIYQQTMIKAFMATKIVLNFIRAQNNDAHNMRTFEVPASGAFLLTQRTHAQANVLFKEDESIACFETKDELVKKIEYYLANPEKRQKIAQQGHNAVQAFTLTKQLINYFNSCPRMQRYIKKDFSSI